MKKNIKIVIDMVMVCLLPLLMAYSLIGEKFHEIAGTAIFILFITHHVLNRNWYKALPKGKYGRRRIFQTVLDVLLLIFMILQPLSGILMSKHLYTFLPSLPVSAATREMHLVLAYWGFVLLSLHAGTHLNVPLNKLKKKQKNAWTVLIAVLAAISVYGVFAFVKRGFPGYMFMRTMFAFFDFGEPAIYFVLDYLAVMILFAMAGMLIVRMLEKKK